MLPLPRLVRNIVRETSTLERWEFAENWWRRKKGLDKVGGDVVEWRKKRKGGRKGEMQYVYGGWHKREIVCEGLLSQVEDTSDKYEDLAIFSRRLSESEEKEHELKYLGKIEE